MNTNRRAAGWLAHRRGDSFEAWFEYQMRCNEMQCVRIPNGCKQVGRYPNGLPKLTRIKSPFDYICAMGQSTILVDLKAFDAPTFPHSALTKHQVETLLELHRPPVRMAGYICLYRKSGQIVFFDALKLATLKPRQSLKEAQGLFLGTMTSFNPKALFLAPLGIYQTVRNAETKPVVGDTGNG